MKEPRTPIPWTPRIILRLSVAEDIDFAVLAANQYAKLMKALTEWYSHVERWHSEGAAGEGRRCTDCIEHERFAHDAIEDVERELGRGSPIEPN